MKIVTVTTLQVIIMLSLQRNKKYLGVSVYELYDIVNAKKGKESLVKMPTIRKAIKSLINSEFIELSPIKNGKINNYIITKNGIKFCKDANLIK